MNTVAFVEHTGNGFYKAAIVNARNLQQYDYDVVEMLSDGAERFLFAIDKARKTGLPVYYAGAFEVLQDKQ